LCAMTDKQINKQAGSSRLPTRSSAGGIERPDGAEGAGVALKAKPKTKKPSLYKVLLMNDDFTPMDFVITVLQKFFYKTIEEATAIMLKVHTTGIGVCGVYTYEVAETKVSQVMDFGRQHQHPLQCTMEKE
jgi:ATP-dependent Clp protease adaptor protein ClpS